METNESKSNGNSREYFPPARVTQEFLGDPSSSAFQFDKLIGILVAQQRELRKKALTVLDENS